MTARRPTLDRERAAWSAARLLVGVDEAGRGPLAGPVVAAAVVFPVDAEPPAGLRDSKTLSARQRAELLPAIRAHALVVGVGAASVREIDRLNIRVATALAMRRAVRKALEALESLEFLVLLDGLQMKELGYPHDALVDGDAHCVTIAAAGIVAKETRDRLMHALDRRHPAYGWASNSGYGTAQHLAALRSAGPTRHHRTSFGPVSQLSL
ncbi:MAG: ribonuclease HII [Gemmatimonadetes bacterium]|nr:ribonuclease HII [Gemmatimonadota bacterium]